MGLSSGSIQCVSFQDRLFFYFIIFIIKSNIHTLVQLTNDNKFDEEYKQMEKNVG